MDNNEKIKSGEMPIKYREVKPYWVRGFKMTDEKMAEKWVTVNTGFNPKEPLGILAVRTYLAGLKAGKDMNVHTKWHKVADGDLPKEDTTVLVCYQGQYTIHYDIDYYCNKCFKWKDLRDIIAWCEIPEYTEE